MSTWLHRKIASSTEKLRRGRVWCTSCGRSIEVDSAECLATGWPKCCGLTMTIDSPAERRGRRPRRARST
jgi:hypothetical protein